MRLCIFCFIVRVNNADFADQLRPGDIFIITDVEACDCNTCESTHHEDQRNDLTNFARSYGPHVRAKMTHVHRRGSHPHPGRNHDRSSGEAMLFEGERCAVCGSAGDTGRAPDELLADTETYGVTVYKHRGADPDAGRAG
jgi:hypothetical protein